MIGLRISNIETFNNFVNFREKWYVDTKMVFTKKDIANKVDYVISDMEIPDTYTKSLVFGKDLQNFEELGSYTQLVRSGEIKDDKFISQLSLLENLDIDVDIADELIEDIESDFEGYSLDTEKFLTPEVMSRRLEKQREEIEKLKRKRDAEEALEKERLEQERLKAEQERLERERQEKLEQERLERERQEKLEQERKEQERILAEQKHKLDMERIQREREIQLALEKEKMELALKEQELEAERLRAEMEAKAKGIELAKTSLINKATFKIPVIPESLIPQKPKVGRLRIGGKRNTAKSNIFLIGSTIGGVGGTTVAYNLAYSLKRNNPDDVLLIDLDFLASRLNNLLSIEDYNKYSISNAFTNEYIDFVQNIQYSVSHKILGDDREVSILTSINYNELSPQDIKIVDSYDFTKLLQSLTTKFKTIIVDIGNLSTPKEYQKILLSNKDFKSVLIYDGTSDSSIKSCINTTQRLLGDWRMILTKVPRGLNRITVEKETHIQVLGTIPSIENYCDAVSLLEKDRNSNVVNSWSEILKNL